MIRAVVIVIAAAAAVTGAACFVDVDLDNGPPILRPDSGIRIDAGADSFPDAGADSFPDAGVSPVPDAALAIDAAGVDA